MELFHSLCANLVFPKCCILKWNYIFPSKSRRSNFWVRFGPGCLSNTESTAEREVGGKKKPQKWQQKMFWQFKYFSCRIVSRTTRLMELQSECVFSFLFSWLISEVGKLCFVRELCCISYFQSALDCPCGSFQLFRRYLVCKKSYLLHGFFFKVTWYFLKL